MTTFAIPDMSCGHCKAVVEQTVRAVDPGATLDFDMGARQVHVTSQTSVVTLQAALEKAGYPATLA